MTKNVWAAEICGLIDTMPSVSAFNIHILCIAEINVWTQNIIWVKSKIAVVIKIYRITLIISF